MMSFTNSHNPQSHPNFPQWMNVYHQTAGPSGITVFDNDFTTRYGISAGFQANAWRVAAHGQMPALGPDHRVPAVVYVRRDHTGGAVLQPQPQEVGQGKDDQWAVVDHAPEPGAVFGG